MRRGVLHVLFALVVTVTSASACTTLLGAFDVAPGCSELECCADADCPAAEGECKVAVCDGGSCVTQNKAAGTILDVQTPGDCKERSCDDAGAVVEEPFDDDALDDGLECTTDLCSSGAPVNMNVFAGTACPVTQGRYCDGSGACVECVEPAQCASGVCGASGACLPAACADKVKNGDETDVDCGGACDGCDTGEVCLKSTDCYSRVCGADGTCAPPTCDDGVKNGGGHLENNGETDVDCGGPCGATCGPMKGCAANEDCVGLECSGSVCIPNCADKVKNNSETDVDCGGGCQGGCQNGQKCSVVGDCASAFCADGVCCDKACTGECLACTAALKGGGADGACGPIAAGTDPKNECAPEAPSTCGNLDGMCSGAAGCKKHPAGTPCGSSPSCAAGVQTNQDTCSGTGACTDNGTTPCGVYACGATACNTSCTADAQCASTAYCNGTACAAKQANGAMCSGNSACTSGFCVDGVCCNTACTAACQACSAARKGAGANGVCGNIKADTDPDLECQTECNGLGACEAATGAACTTSAQCQTGFCVDNVCCDSACTFTCMACSNAKTGAANGACASVKVNTDPDNECINATSCNGSGACALYAQGAACTAAAECVTGFCVDNVCCNTACGAICRACAAAKTGGVNGTCANVTAGTDPDSECNGVTPNCAAGAMCGP